MCNLRKIIEYFNAYFLIVPTLPDQFVHYSIFQESPRRCRRYYQQCSGMVPFLALNLPLYSFAASSPLHSAYLKLAVVVKPFVDVYKYMSCICIWDIFSLFLHGVVYMVVP